MQSMMCKKTAWDGTIFHRKCSSSSNRLVAWGRVSTNRLLPLIPVGTLKSFGGSLGYLSSRPRTPTYSSLRHPINVILHRPPMSSLKLICSPLSTVFSMVSDTQLTNYYAHVAWCLTLKLIYSPVCAPALCTVSYIFLQTL